MRKRLLLCQTFGDRVTSKQLRILELVCFVLLSGKFVNYSAWGRWWKRIGRIKGTAELFDIFVSFFFQWVKTCQKLGEDTTESLEGDEAEAAEMHLVLHQTLSKVLSRCLGSWIIQRTLRFAMTRKVITA